MKKLQLEKQVLRSSFITTVSQLIILFIFSNPSTSGSYAKALH
jgi:hypothetical protein